MQESLLTNDDLAYEQAVWDRQRLQAALLADKADLLSAIRPRLLRLARLRGVDADALEDVVQETLLEAWKHLERLQSLDGLQPWVEEICRNVCHRWARRHWAEAQHAASPLVLARFDEGDPGADQAPFMENIPDVRAVDLSEALSRQDLAVLLNRALGALPDAARQVVELCYLTELPQREAALRLGLSISALEARLHRARLQLRQALNGPLRAEAEALGLSPDAVDAAGWHETRLWCSLCGQRRLRGTFVPQPDGSANLHLDCPACLQRYGLKSVHSMGLVQLGELRAFRPAWKRTMQGLANRLLPALAQGWHACLRCGAPAPIQVIQADEHAALPASPYRFWVSWRCARCGEEAHPSNGLLTADELVYWSHPLTRQFILERPRWISKPDELVEYMGQPAIHLQLEDMTSTARLDVLADRQTLRILALS